MKVVAVLCLITIIALAGLSGCFALPPEEDNLPPAFFALAEPPPWRTVNVTQGDVELFTTISATHQAALQEVIRFPVGNAPVTGIYVNLGDEVQAGDIIASLDRTDVENELGRMTRDESRLMLRIEQLTERHEHTLWMAEMTETPVDDSFYVNLLTDLHQDLYMLRLEINYIERQLENRLLRTSMDGVVTSVITHADGMRAMLNQQVAIIADQTVSIFVSVVRDTGIMQVGDRFEMDVAGNIVWAEVIDPQAHGIVRPEVAWEEAILIVDGGVVFAPRVMGRIHAVFASAYDVVRAPSRVVHSVDERHFVYVLEDGVRHLRFVEVGLEGSIYTEIISGLEPGEVLVI